MPEYRVFCINGSHICAVNVIECDDDDSARLQGAALLGRCKHSAAEVWDRERFVCRVGDAAAASPEAGRAPLAAASRRDGR